MPAIIEKLVDTLISRNVVQIWKELQLKNKKDLKSKHFFSTTEVFFAGRIFNDLNSLR